MSELFATKFDISKRFLYVSYRGLPTGEWSLKVGMLKRLFTFRRSAHWGPKDTPSRSIFTMAVENNGDYRSILWQHYPTGCALEPHKDLHGGHNNIVWLLLRKAKSGGETKVYGAHRHWLRGRIMAFDGGETLHEVTKVVEGSRTSLIFQHGYYTNSPEQEYAFKNQYYEAPASQQASNGPPQAEART